MQRRTDCLLSITLQTEQTGEPYTEDKACFKRTRSLEIIYLCIPVQNAPTEIWCDTPAATENIGVIRNSVTSLCFVNFMQLVSQVNSSQLYCHF